MLYTVLASVPTMPGILSVCDSLPPSGIIRFPEEMRDMCSDPPMCPTRAELDVHSRSRWLDWRIPVHGLPNRLVAEPIPQVMNLPVRAPPAFLIW